MMYEIQVRPAAQKNMTGAHLLWIESPLGTRGFEAWLRKQGWLTADAKGAVARYRIMQTTRPAHFSMETDEAALIARVETLHGSREEVVSMDAGRRARAQRSSTHSARQAVAA